MSNAPGPPRLEINGLDDTSFDDLYHSVSGVNAEAHGAEKGFNRLSDEAMDMKDKVSDFQNNTLYKGVMAVKDADPGELVSKSVAAIAKFSENSAVIMKGLDAVKTLHPFVGIVVLAFQAAIQLELTRRENDKKVLALKTEMMNMMEILLDLKTMKDAQKVDPNGTTLEGRMQGIVKDAEQDIRDCSAICEKYMKKKFVVRLFDGSRWEGRLAAFSDAFSKRRIDFSFALSVRTAQGVDNVQQTLVGIAANVNTGSGSAAMLLLFRQLESPKERELQKWIADKGGAAIVSGNEKLFKELQSKMKGIKDAMPIKGETTDTLMLTIRTEMRENIDSSLARDRQQFNRKFDAVQDKLEEIKARMNTVGRSTDRWTNALTELTGGPHDRIKDMDLHAVWKDMAWRGSVKARHFVVALQDHFLQKYSKEDQEMSDAIGDAAQGISRPISPALSVGSAGTDGPPPSVLVPRALEARTAHHELEDRWAIDYITLTRVQPILEAFDGDGSGWISVQEANAFTSSRPADYSVAKWLAFWAAGFKNLCARYAKDITNLRARMTAISADVLPFNRARVYRYMANTSLDVIDRIIHDLRADWDDYYDDDEDLMSRFTDYIESEKTRLTKELERFGWEIDAQNTLQLIAGTGHKIPIVDGRWAIERHILPLIFLLLKRHALVVQLACEQPLDDREFWDAERSIDILVSAIRQRILTLESHFKTQNRDPASVFEVAYSGMFKTAYLYFTKSDVNGYSWENPQSYYESESDEAPDAKILKYETPEVGPPDFMYRDVGQDDEVPTHPFNGLWTGTYSYHLYDVTRNDGLVSAHLHFVDDEGQNAFTGSGRDSVGSFKISGNLTALDSSPYKRQISFTKGYQPVKGRENLVWTYRGTVSVEDSGRMTAMAGHWGPWVEDPSEFTTYGTFQMDRTPAIVARHRPSVADFETNAAGARWELVLNVVKERVRSKLLNSNHFRQRRNDRQKFVEATVRYVSITEPWRYNRKWKSEDHKDYLGTLHELEGRLRPEDIQFYRWLAERRLQQECVHPGVTCDSCGDEIVGVRYKCLDCMVPSNPSDGIDFCENCKNNPVFLATENRRHNPAAHVLVKTLHVIYRWRWPVIVRWSWQQMQHATEVFAETERYLQSKEHRDGQEEGAENQASSDNDDFIIPNCFYCHKRVSRPHWFCVECDDIFMCDNCDKNWIQMSEGRSKFASSSGTAQDLSHKWYHALVQVKDIVPEQPRMDLDMRLTMLEQQFAAHELATQQKLESLETTVAKLAEKVEKLGLDGRLSNLEELLNEMIAKTT
ncbi:hypothetical protein K438DRAFT_1679952 [Mycena galopus ATCC 62051]|nr:hypothetical protein K438DRAFT_1679952 [Mycena galopus ATCC 62051]